MERVAEASEGTGAVEREGVEAARAAARAAAGEAAGAATSLVGHEMRRSKLHFLWLSPRGCLRCFAAFEFILLPGAAFFP